MFGSGEPVGALGEFLAAVFNQNVTSWRSAPAATSIEHAVVGWLADAVGCAGFTGSLCGGGSAANLMALAMAREAKLPANETGARPCMVYASEQVHMSIPKAIALLGIGRKNLRLIPVDDDFRMRTDALEAAIADDRKAGSTPIAIVATVGTVATGAIDPLHESRTSPQRRTCGCMSMVPMADWRLWRCRKNSRDWPRRIRCHSMRINGCTSRWIAAVCSTAIRDCARNLFAQRGLCEDAQPGP